MIKKSRTFAGKENLVKVHWCSSSRIHSSFFFPKQKSWYQKHSKKCNGEGSSITNECTYQWRCTMRVAHRKSICMPKSCGFSSLRRGSPTRVSFSIAFLPLIWCQGPNPSLALGFCRLPSFSTTTGECKRVWPAMKKESNFNVNLCFCTPKLSQYLKTNQKNFNFHNKMFLFSTVKVFFRVTSI